MKRMEIAPGVHLSWDPAQKFNRCRVSIHFALPAKRETATAHALLPLVMERGYADCPDMTQLTKKLARLYGADLTVDARPMGANHNLCVSVTGIKDQFALEGEPLTQEYAELALGTAFHPYFVGETFDPEAVKIEKQMLKKALEDEVNEKRLYCQRQANREFFGDSPAGVRQEGYLEEVDGLTPEQLTDVLRQAVDTAEELGMELDFTSPGWLEEETLRSLGLNLIPSCGACLSNMAVTPDGKVVPCQSWLSDEPLGDLLHDDWADIWNSPRCAAIRAESAKLEHICQLKGKEAAE